MTLDDVLWSILKVVGTAAASSLLLLASIALVVIGVRDLRERNRQ